MSKRIIQIINAITVIGGIILIIKGRQGGMTSIAEYNDTYKAIIITAFVISLINLSVAGLMLIIKAMSGGTHVEFELAELRHMILMTLLVSTLVLMINTSLSATVESIPIENANVTEVDTGAYLVESSNFEDFYTDRDNIEYASENDNKFLMFYMETEDQYKPTEELLQKSN